MRPVPAGVHCEVFMPVGAAIAKAEAATALGAHVRLVGATFDDSLAAAHERADAGGLVFVHPFDDPEVIAGQGGVGLELADPGPRPCPGAGAPGGRWPAQRRGRGAGRTSAPTSR